MSKIPSVNPEEDDAIVRIDSVPPPGDEEDVYNAGTIVRDAPSDLVEVSRRPNELASGSTKGKPPPPPPRPHSRAQDSADNIAFGSPNGERGNQEVTPPRGTDLMSRGVEGGALDDDRRGDAEQVAPNVEDNSPPSFLASAPNKTSMALVAASVVFGIAAIAFHPSLGIAAGGLLALAVVIYNRQQ